jgi:HEAT repeat protein
MDHARWQRLEKALRDISDVDSAVAAAEELQSSASHADVDALVQLLMDESFFVREAAAWPLSDLGRIDVLPQLLSAFQRGLDEGHDNDGFSTALIGLVQSNRAEAQIVLRSLATDKDIALRENAIWLLEFAIDAHDA